LKLPHIFSRQRGGEESPAASVQTGDGRGFSHPYSGFFGYTPLMPPEASLFDAMREALPIIDAALDKIVRLTGHCKMECSDPSLQKTLDHFLGTVKTGPASYGIYPFISTYLHSLLTYGNAVGEIVPNGDGSGIYALYNAKLSDVLIKRGATPLDVEICAYKGKSTPAPVKYPQLVLFTPLNPPAGELHGAPLLRGLPFISGILMKVFSSLGKNFERVGNLRYAVTYKPGSDKVDKAQAGEIAGNIAKEWSQAMAEKDTVRDFVAVGDVDIKVIGADNQMIETEVPVRQLLEQIIAKLGIPPFMLGISWSTTERMSAQQADILTSELESYRRLLDPVLTKICDMFLRLLGSGATAKPVWEDINLQDEAEAANIRLIDAKVREIDHRINNIVPAADFQNLYP
jgi:hypothetical protein